MCVCVCVCVCVCAHRSVLVECYLVLQLLTVYFHFSHVCCNIIASLSMVHTQTQCQQVESKCGHVMVPFSSHLLQLLQDVTQGVQEDVHVLALSSQGRPHTQCRISTASNVHTCNVANTGPDQEMKYRCCCIVVPAKTN